MEDEKKSYNIMIAILVVLFIIIIGLIVVLGNNPEDINNNEIISEVSNHVTVDYSDKKIVVEEKKAEIENAVDQESKKVLNDKGILVKNYYIDEQKYNKDNIAKIYNEAIRKMFLKDEISIYQYRNNECVMASRFDTINKIGNFNDITKSNEGENANLYMIYKDNWLNYYSMNEEEDRYSQLGEDSNEKDANYKIANTFMNNSLNLKSLISMSYNKVEDYYLEDDVKIDGIDNLCYKIVFKLKVDAQDTEIEIFIDKSNSLIQRINLNAYLNIIAEFKYDEVIEIPYYITLYNY